MYKPPSFVHDEFKKINKIFDADFINWSRIKSFMHDAMLKREREPSTKLPTDRERAKF